MQTWTTSTPWQIRIMGYTCNRECEWGAVNDNDRIPLDIWLQLNCLGRRLYGHKNSQRFLSRKYWMMIWMKFDQTRKEFQLYYIHIENYWLQPLQICIQNLYWWCLKKNILALLKFSSHWWDFLESIFILEKFSCRQY